jgi:hypothetical protein
MRSLSWFIVLASPLWAQLPTCTTPIWTPCELVFPLDPTDRDPQLRAEFRSPHRDTKSLAAFRDANTLVLRFTPDEVGEWDYRVTANLTRFNGPDTSKIGKLTSTPATAPGFVQPANVHHFQTSDLQPHLWFGTSIENFVAIPRAEFDTQLADRASEKFTHVRVTIDSSAADQAALLQEAAERIRAIHNRRLVTDLALSSLPVDRRQRELFLADIAARFSAFNLTWVGLTAYEQAPAARALLREWADTIARLDPYQHPRTTLAEGTSSLLLADKSLTFAAYGSPDPNLGADHSLLRVPSINTGIRTRADLWNATMNGHYPSSGSGRAFAVWFDLLAHTRYWEMEPYFDLTGGRAIAVRDYETTKGDNHWDAVEYLVYLETPGPIELTVESHNYEVAWIDPATGTRTPAKDYKGKLFTGTPPDRTHDWLLYLSREGHKEGLLKKYKFESRRATFASPETNAATLPFEIASPSGDISIRDKPAFALKSARETRASRDAKVLWTAEMSTGNEGGRVVGIGPEGALALPPSFLTRVPAVLSLRATVLSGTGKIYLLDRTFRLVE